MTTLQVGFARQDITPALGTLLMGYADPNRKAERVRDRIYASTLVFEDQGVLSAIVSADVCLIGDEFIQRIRDEAAAATGIPAGNLLIVATHTHSAPCTAGAWGWNDADLPFINNIFIPQIIRSLVDAKAALRPARLGVGTTECHAGINRRGIMPNHHTGWHNRTWGVFDPTLTILRFEGASGPVANIVHYGAHPTVFNSSTRAISRDWPGVVVDRVTQLTGAPTIFVNGAFGDIAPRTATGYAVADGDGEAGLAEAAGVACVDAIRAWRNTKDIRDSRMFALAEEYLLPYRDLPPLEEARRELAALEPRKNEYGLAMAGYQYWSRVVAAHSAPPVKGKRYLQSMISLGPVVFVPVPGEPFADTVMRLREVSPFQHTLIAGTTNGSNGYFYTRDSLHRGGYEVDVVKAMNHFLMVENIEDVLVDENLKMIKQLHNRVYPPMA